MAQPLWCPGPEHALFNHIIPFSLRLILCVKYNMWMFRSC